MIRRRRATPLDARLVADALVAQSVKLVRAAEVLQGTIRGTLPPVVPVAPRRRKP